MFTTLKKMIKKSIIKIIPVKKNRIVFTSFNGHYADSPKYICEKIHDLNDTLELIWIVNKKYEKLLPKYVKYVEYGSKKAWYYYASACAIVDNVYAEKELYLMSDDRKSRIKHKVFKFLHTKKKQHVYTTWHGISIKKMGRDDISHKKIYDFDCPNTTMILGSKFSLDMMQHLTFDKVKMKLIGYPRNDLLYDATPKSINSMKKKLGLPLDKKIILFAPTFRSDAGTFDKNVRRSGLEQLEQMDLERFFNTLREKFGGEWALVCRFHYHVEKLVEWDKLRHEYGDRIINGNENDDMAEYLLCTDILLSDASSCVFDFAITKKPIFNIFPDFDYYQNKERGLYIPTEDFPYEISEKFEDLLLNIKDFDNEKYSTKLNKFSKKYGCMHEENSAKKIAKYILNELK